MTRAHPDPAAAQALACLLTAAVGRLMALEEPILVAACPRDPEEDRSDDAPWWAVVAGGRSAKGVNAPVERGKGPRFRGPHPASAAVASPGGIGDPAAGADATRALAGMVAYDVLVDLVEGGWGGLLARATGAPLPEATLALAVAYGAPWLLLSPTAGGAGRAYLIDRSGTLLHVGEPDPVHDLAWSHLRPVRLARIDPSTWPVLHAAVPAFPATPAPEGTGVERQAANKDLAHLVRQAAGAMAEVPEPLRFLAVSQVGPPETIIPALSRRWRMVAAGGSAIAGSPFLPRHTYDERLANMPGSVQHLDAVVEWLEQAEWRDLFARAFMRLKPQDPLAILVRGTELWVIAARTAVFALEDDGLRFAGACDWTDDPARLATLPIHLFPPSGSASTLPL